MRSERLLITSGRRPWGAPAPPTPSVGRGGARDRRQQPSRVARAPHAAGRQLRRWL